MPADERMLRTFDLADVRVPRSVARQSSGATRRRHAVGRPGQHPPDALRTCAPTAADPMFMLMTIRPETASVTELVSLLADSSGWAILRRIPVGRLRQTDRRPAQGPARWRSALTTTATIHAQAEGVPFIVEEAGPNAIATPVCSSHQRRLEPGAHAERLRSVRSAQPDPAPRGIAAACDARRASPRARSWAARSA